MLRFIQSTPVSGDCTCGYKVLLEKEYTVRDFINTILSERSGEFGYIGIYNPSMFWDRTCGSPCAEYRYGQIALKNFDDKIDGKMVSSVSASGGWGRMDYILHIE